MKVNLQCFFCKNHIEKIIDVPGWEIHYGEVDIGDAFCPIHALANEFLNDVCAGCVDAWPGCAFYKSLTDLRKFEDEDLLKIAEGKCPKRCNGTLAVDNATKTFKNVDISSKPSEEAIKGMLKAVKDCIAQAKEIDRQVDEYRRTHK